MNQLRNALQIASFLLVLPVAAQAVDVRRPTEQVQCGGASASGTQSDGQGGAGSPSCDHLRIRGGSPTVHLKLEQQTCGPGRFLSTVSVNDQAVNLVCKEPPEEMNGGGVERCGDNICSGSESGATCPGDCSSAKACPSRNVTWSTGRCSANSPNLNIGETRSLVNTNSREQVRGSVEITCTASGLLETSPICDTLSDDAGAPQEPASCGVVYAALTDGFTAANEGWQWAANGGNPPAAQAVMTVKGDSSDFDKPYNSNGQATLFARASFTLLNGQTQTIVNEYNRVSSSVQRQTQTATATCNNGELSVNVESFRTSATVDACARAFLTYKIGSINYYQCIKLMGVVNNNAP